VRPQLQRGRMRFLSPRTLVCINRRPGSNTAAAAAAADSTISKGTS